MWTSIPVLDFEDKEALARIATNKKCLHAERSKYINKVNRIMRKHSAVSLDSFRIFFDFPKTFKTAVDIWVKFAVGKMVQKLELNLLERGDAIRHLPRNNYVFPYKLLTQTIGSRLKKLLPGDLSMGHGLKCLTNLSLKCVNLNEEALEGILTNCPALQSLSIYGSEDLVNVRVMGRSLVLRSLQIVFCTKIMTIEIRETNLVEFIYTGQEIDLILEDVPRLNDISFRELHPGLGYKVFNKISNCLNQLEFLTLNIYHPEVVYALQYVCFCLLKLCIQN